MFPIMAIAPLLWALSAVVAIRILTRTRAPHGPSARIETIEHDDLRPAA